MNYVSTYTIFDKEFFQSFSYGGKYAWLPIDKTNMVIVFNLRSDTIDFLLRKKQPHIFFFSDNSDAKSNMPISNEEFQKQCHRFNDRIEKARKSDEKYNILFYENLRKSLQVRSSGYNDWLIRCSLYGGLFGNNTLE